MAVTTSLHSSPSASTVQIWSRQASVFKINAMQSAVHTQGVSQRLATLGAHAVPAYAEHRDRVVGLQSLHKVSKVKYGVS